MYRTLYPSDIFSELDRLQRELTQAFEFSPNIRGRGSYPALNVGGTPQSVEIYAFAPGMAPDSIEVKLERGVLTIAGERRSAFPAEEERASIHIGERFTGRFRRVLSLPDDIDANAVEARYRDGVLHISIRRREAAQPRRITVQ